MASPRAHAILGSLLAVAVALGIACAPFHPARIGLDDPRELGVAVFAVRFERLTT